MVERRNATEWQASASVVGGHWPEYMATWCTCVSVSAMYPCPGHTLLTLTGITSTNCATLPWASVKIGRQLIQAPNIHP